MYTQNFNKSPVKTQVITFQNKDSIAQMKSLSTRNNKQQNFAESENKSKTTSHSNNAIDSLLLFGALLGISESSAINANVFPLIAGVLLTL